MWNLFSRKQVEAEPQRSRLAESLVLDPFAEVPAAQQRNRIAEVQRIGPTAVATLTVTELTQEKGVDMLANLLDELGQTGATHYVLDIQNVQFMDSACLGCLVEALNRLASAGGRIALANTPNSVQYLFKMTQLDRVFPICADVMAAIQAVERVPGQE